MNSFRCFLDDLCLNTGIEFNLVEENGLEIYTGLNKQISETISFNIELNSRKIDVCISKKQENNINLLKYIIWNKYKEICFIKEQILQDLLNGKDVGTDKIEKNLWFLKKYITNIDSSVKQELMDKFKTKFDVFDNELIETIQQFINCGLNISDTSRNLYIHRNTLIYRLDKIKKETGFDIRKFTDATVFIISFFIWKGKYK